MPNVRTVIWMPRHSNDSAPWRNVKFKSTRDVHRSQQSLQKSTTIRGSERCVKSGQLPFKNRLLDFSVRLPLSLQNGVFRSLGDTGAQAPPTLKPGPIRMVTVLLLSRLSYTVGQSRCLCARRVTISQNVEEEEVKETQVNWSRGGRTVIHEYIVFPHCTGTWISLSNNEIMLFPSFASSA